MKSKSSWVIIKIDPPFPLKCLHSSHLPYGKGLNYFRGGGGDGESSVVIGYINVTDTKYFSA